VDNFFQQPSGGARLLPSALDLHASSAALKAQHLLPEALHLTSEQRDRADSAEVLHQALRHPNDASLCSALDTGLLICSLRLIDIYCLSTQGRLRRRACGSYRVQVYLSLALCSFSSSRARISPMSSRTHPPRAREP
jgi:hypothetical protein